MFVQWVTGDMEEFSSWPYQRGIRQQAVAEAEADEEEKRHHAKDEEEGEGREEENSAL